MKWKYIDKEALKKEAVKKWHKWFAWYPVEIDGYYHWLKIVERRWITLTIKTLRDNTGAAWEYRESEKKEN